MATQGGGRPPGKPNRPGKKSSAGANPGAGAKGRGGRPPGRGGRPGGPGRSGPGSQNRRPQTARKPRPETPANAAAGLPARSAAVAIVDAITAKQQKTEEAIASAFSGQAASLEPRDRAMARRIAMAAVRRFHSLEATLLSYLERGFPKRSGPLRTILIAAAAELLLLDAPAHAAIDSAVSLAKADRRAGPFAGLANAVLRRVSETGTDRLADCKVADHDIPKWLMDSWRAAYGAETAAYIAEASVREPALDITVKSDPGIWAERLGAVHLPTGSLRRKNDGRIDGLPGFEDGAWWVQDAASALPARLFGDVKGLRIADICAAPGGKTAQLANAGGVVTALDQSEQRLVRLRENLTRLGLTADVVTADATAWQPGAQFDAVLLDAPCSATGTIRRHPDILFHRAPDQIEALSRTQAALIDAAHRLTRPGGTLIYCACSLQPEEGPDQIAQALARFADLQRVPITPAADNVPVEMITAEGDLRILPYHLQFEDAALSGIDGFFAARLRKA